MWNLSVSGRRARARAWCALSCVDRMERLLLQAFGFQMLRDCVLVDTTNEDGMLEGSCEHTSMIQIINRDSANHHISVEV